MEPMRAALFSLALVTVTSIGCGGAPSEPSPAIPGGGSAVAAPGAPARAASAPAPSPRHPPAPAPPAEASDAGGAAASPDAAPRCRSPRDVAATVADPGDDTLAWLSRRQIKLRNRILFEINKAELRAESRPVLDAVADILLRDLALCVEVQGHSDYRGSRERLLQLTQERAEAVMHYLVQKGVDAARLTARGYGPDRPISHPPEGPRGNRRIDFVIVEHR
jgi:outer membrane protein OmpA-like peptidoglycan-associated protein